MEKLRLKKLEPVSAKQASDGGDRFCFSYHLFGIKNLWPRKGEPQS